MVFANTLFVILINGRMVPAIAMITSSVMPERRGGFMSINSSIQQFSMGLSAYWAGLIIEQSAQGRLTGFDTVGNIAAVFTIICVIYARKLKSPQSDKAGEVIHLHGPSANF